MRKTDRSKETWYTMDIHLHTPASMDYQQADVSFLEILQKAELRGLDIVGITDHNTVAGFANFREEIGKLELLESLKRLLPEESLRLKEYRRLMQKILILPGFEFTATFGFHILALFSPKKPIREIEHLLLSLSISPDHLDEGNPAIGSSVDVLTAYQTINEAGGLVIAAHANSSNGVAMRGLGFGGQTRIAYTQDVNLHALEVTDLEQRGPRTTAAFFSGTKPEYPRRMHCIQGSDSHRLVTDPARKKNLGVGDRSTDILLPEPTFEALFQLFTSNDFFRTRPHRHIEEAAFDFIQAALEEGPNIIQDFHDAMTIRGGKLYAILADTCAFANTNGGTLFIGMAPDPQKPPLGIGTPEQAIKQLEKEISDRIHPPLSCSMDVQDFRKKKIVRILVPRGDDVPYAVDENKIYIRSESDTALAVRDEIVNMVLREKSATLVQLAAAPPPPLAILPQPLIPPVEEAHPAESDDGDPRTGVEVIPEESASGKVSFTLRDLRNRNTVKHVTRASARQLWHYAISKYLETASTPEKTSITWQGDYGLARTYGQAKAPRFDLVQRTPKGYRYFYGVTEEGIRGNWKKLVGLNDDN